VHNNLRVLAVLVKFCNGCSSYKSLELFGSRGAIRSSHSRSKCKDCRYKQRDKVNQEKQAYVNNYKLEKGCNRCGYNTCSAALEFHHPNDDKWQKGKRAVNATWGYDRINAEIIKCEVLCANCHREHHFLK
jgi:hypothetical protein